MPELPEVEVNRRGLERLVQDKVIKNVQVFWPKIVADMDVTAWQERLIDQQIPVSYTHLTLPTILRSCRSRWSPYH